MGLDLISIDSSDNIVCDKYSFGLLDLHIFGMEQPLEIDQKVDQRASSQSEIKVVIWLK